VNVAPGEYGPSVRICSGARDLVTGPIGASLLAEARVAADIAGDRTLTTLRTMPRRVDPTELLGSSVASGFRGVVETILGPAATSSPLGVALADLATGAHLTDPAGDGGLAAAAGGGGLPARLPVATSLEDAGDPWSWHPVGVLPWGAVRRRRRYDLTVLGGDVVVDALLRDSRADADAGEVVLREWELAVWIDLHALRVLEIAAVPVVPSSPEHVTPPVLTALMGAGPAELRAAARTAVGGGLGDLLASLADLWPLLPRLEESAR
jgi:hypothetical protein